MKRRRPLSLSTRISRVPFRRKYRLDGVPREPIRTGLCGGGSPLLTSAPSGPAAGRDGSGGSISTDCWSRSSSGGGRGKPGGRETWEGTPAPLRRTWCCGMDGRGRCRRGSRHRGRPGGACRRCSGSGSWEEASSARTTRRAQKGWVVRGTRRMGWPED